MKNNTLKKIIDNIIILTLLIVSISFAYTANIIPQKRKRSTTIVETDNGILLVSHSRHGKPTYMLPGGKVRNGESSVDGAKRELYEETGLHAINTTFLFSFETRHNKHNVFLVETRGKIMKRNETTHIQFYNNHTKNKYKLAWHVKPIIEKYYKINYKK